METKEQPGLGQEPKSEAEESRDLFIGVALRGAVTLQKALGLNEDTYQGVAGHSLHDSRAYYLYGVLDEVLKAATAMLRWQQLLKNPEKEGLKEIQGKENGNHLIRIVDEAVQDEQDLWSRKLAELLCNLILFESTNSQEYFRLFLTCEHLDAYLGLQRDFHDFFNCQNFNARESIQSLVSTTKQCTKSIPLKKAWFLNDAINWEKPIKPGGLFCSIRQRYKLALKKADPDQILALGISYEHGYSVPSRSIHANIGGPPMKIDRKAIEISFSHVVLFCALVMLQAYKVAGVTVTGDAEFVDKIFKSGTDARKILNSVYGKELEVGDIVFAYGKDLCIVVDKRRSEYGYNSYKVKYLSPPLIPEVPEDWFPARYVHLVWPKKLVREQMVDMLERHHFPADAVEKVRSMPDKDLLDQLVSTALAAYKDGVFDQMFAIQTDR
ncbi:MAG: hypothetical protein WCH20_10720 [Nitrospira sp.]